MHSCVIIITLCRCFGRHPAVLYGTLFGPIFAIGIFNIILLICVIVILVRNKQRNLVRPNHRITTKEAVQLLISIIAVALLFGVHWILGAIIISIRPTPSTEVTAFQVVFIFITAFQGLSFFFFFCVVSKEARESWRRLFPCYNSKSKQTSFKPSMVAGKIMTDSHKVLNCTEDSVENMAEEDSCQQNSLETCEVNEIAKDFNTSNSKNQTVREHQMGRSILQPNK